MGALVDSFRAAGIAFAALPGGRLHATGPITDATRTAIREHKAAILAELSSANDPDDGMRPCTDCRNLTAKGQCLAAWRGESFGAGVAVGRDYYPGMTDRAQRCAPYKPGPGDPDRRTGAERWPWLLRDVEK